jgi:dihydrofolate synthase/folylpolyglutamate synthase
MHLNINHQSLQSWLNYLETLHTKSIDLGLDRIKQVAHSLQLLPFPQFVITVAGTNGKGTSVALLENIFIAAGYHVGSYTSPHLLKYNERTKINAIPVADDALCEAFAIIEQARGQISLTYFEFGTLAALWLFKQANLDAVVLEIGLGGRLDAVNIVDADIALISTIALDHMEYLGHDRESIGKEKAGILRAHKPAVCGDYATPDSICAYAQEIQAPLFLQDKDFRVEQINEYFWNWNSKTKQLLQLPIPKIPLQNAAAVLKVIELLPAQFNITDQHIIKALQTVQVAGRFHLIPGKVPTIVDVAHNPAAAAWLANKLHQHPIQGRTLAVIGMLADKDHYTTAKQLAQVVTEWFVGGLSVPRGMSAEELAASVREATRQKVNCYNTVTMAYEQALQQAQVNDRIIVLGSFFTVAEVMQHSYNRHSAKTVGE